MFEPGAQILKSQHVTASSGVREEGSRGSVSRAILMQLSCADWNPARRDALLNANACCENDAACPHVPSDPLFPTHLSHAPFLPLFLIPTENVCTLLTGMMHSQKHMNHGGVECARSMPSSLTNTMQMQDGTHQRKSQERREHLYTKKLRSQKHVKPRIQKPIQNMQECGKTSLPLGASNHVRSCNPVSYTHLRAHETEADL
eukprot:2375877-Rhodomonas_salina.2